MSGPLPDSLAPLTLPASWLYGGVMKARNRRYDRGIGVEMLNVPVISVGNLTTGGTGKTPMVMWIAELLRAHSRRPAIAMRGYGGDVAHPSDEAVEYAERLPEIPILVNKDRFAACRAHLEANPATDCIILDDGFQHRQLHRDIDLVLIDASRDLKKERMLPAGHLREPLPNLARADAVILTRAEPAMSGLISEIERHHGRPPIAWSRHRWAHLRLRDQNHDLRTKPTWLAGKRLLTLLGIGNPDALIAQLEAAGANIVGNIPAADHERFTPAKIEVAKGLCDGLDGIVLTAKDWARARNLIDLNTWPCPIVIPIVQIDVFAGQSALEARILSAFDR